MEEVKAQEQKKANSFLENLGLIPKLSIILIIVSLLFHTMYYNHFGLPIKYFMNITEFGIAISEDLIYLIPIYLILIAITEFANYIHNKYLVEIRKEKFFTEARKGIFNNPILQRFIVVCITITLIWLEYNMHHNLEIFKYILIPLLAFFIINLMTTKDTFETNSLLGKKFFSFIILFILILISRFWFVIHNVEKGKYEGTIITTSENKYISNDTSYFIGKTEQYIFIHFTKDSSTLVIPSESIKQMIIKTK